MTDTEILKKIKERLKEEVDTYKEYANDIGDVDSYDDGILEGRHECADSLLQQMEKWKGGE